ncbi:MAG: PHP domain-containing protein [Deltaproteobacteria bacterium]|nr:PHP domain-containing protein [Deltaproteobacteria bacterium]
MRRPLALSLSLAGCFADDGGCFSRGGDGCVPAAPCAALSWRCEGGFATVRRITRPEERPEGLAALGTVGDYLFENDQLRAVIDAPEHPHYTGVTGGRILDLAPRGGADHLHYVCHATGVLPGDMAHYHHAAVLPSGDRATLVLHGYLAADPAVEVSVRYELRPCDRGLRVRTELFNGGRRTWPLFLSDFVLVGRRDLTPFAPLAAMGFRHPPVDPYDLQAAWHEVPWLSAQSHAPPYAAYAEVACDAQTLGGFVSAEFAALGPRPALVAPGDGLSFERVVLTAPGEGLSAVHGLVREVHRQLHGDPWVSVSGRVLDGLGVPLGGDEREVSIFVEDVTQAPTPVDLAVPGSDGSYRLALPPGRRYRLQPWRHGRPEGMATEVTLGTMGPVALPTLSLPRPGRLTVRVTDANGAPLDAEVVLLPTSRADPGAAPGTLYGVEREGCSPFLGDPHGPSPACNRALVPRGEASFNVPSGRWMVYVTAGPGYTLARRAIVNQDARDEILEVRLVRIPGLYPSTVLHADLHVHGGRSSDAAIPDRDRLQSFVSAGVRLIAATDHDVCADYGAALEAFRGRLEVLTGVETTGLLPFLRVGSSALPHTIGHANFWPLRCDPSRPRNGAPWDELLEPAELFDLLRAEGGADAVIQLNHPTLAPIGGIDQGLLRVLAVDPRRALPAVNDGSGPGRLWSRPGGRSRNVDWDVQEVMNGADLLRNLQYRALWHALLSQGVVRAGTANSDTHSLQAEQAGWPRNLVFMDTTTAPVEVAAFNRAVRLGRVVGSNGPVVLASVTDSEGRARGPSVLPFQPSREATLTLEVRAAPWIPVDEVRLVVNGALRRRWSGAEVARPDDPFGQGGVRRLMVTVPLRELLGGRDGWVVVEAGSALPAVADQDDDGLPDHIDGDGDGVAAELAPRAPGEGDPRVLVDAVSPGTWPMAFTNPFLLDLAGDGWEPPGL